MEDCIGAGQLVQPAGGHAVEYTVGYAKTGHRKDGVDLSRVVAESRGDGNGRQKHLRRAVLGRSRAGDGADEIQPA